MALFMRRTASASNAILKPTLRAMRSLLLWTPVFVPGKVHKSILAQNLCLVVGQAVLAIDGNSLLEGSGGLIPATLGRGQHSMGQPDRSRKTIPVATGFEQVEATLHAFRGLGVPARFEVQLGQDRENPQLDQDVAATSRDVEASKQERLGLGEIAGLDVQRAEKHETCADGRK